MANYQNGIYYPGHPLDRPGQSEALEWILESNKKYLILRAPTGFGKSPLAAYTSIDYKTMALVAHKSLQTENYLQQYDFLALMGKGNYPCENSPYPSMVPYSAFDCGEKECDCPYQVEVQRLKEGMRSSLNYAKYLNSLGMIPNLGLRYLYLDEAHNLPNLITDFVGFTVRWDNEFVKARGVIKPVRELGDEKRIRLDYPKAMQLLRQCARAAQTNKPAEPNTRNEKELRKYMSKLRAWKRLMLRIERVNDTLANGELNHWYYEANQDGLVIKPLTAKYHFKSLFKHADKVVLMSATIRPSIAERLGIEDEFDFLEIPNNWPAMLRPIYDLGGPAINYRSSDKDKDKQAQLIASIMDHGKSGVIHVMSEYQAHDIKKRVNKLDNRHFRFYIPRKGDGTDKYLQDWYNLRQPGAYCISWAFHEGVDLGGDDIVIMAKTPFTKIGEGYEQERKNFDPQWYLEMTAYLFEQALGRNRRGIDEHYGPDGNQVFIADSAYHRIKDYLSDDLKQAIRRYNNGN